MRTALARLGDLLRTLRQQRGLTQEQLASVIEPKTNRSAIAHFEQGLRLPKKEVFSAICTYFSIPDPDWKFLETVQATQIPTAAAETDNLPRIVAIAGIPGSGKSTLARGLSGRLNAVQLPTETPAKKYLGDLGVDRKRWAFETQLAFLCFNSLQLMQKARSGHRLVIDRSLQEDVHIFAQLFRDCGDIDERSFLLYQALADYFISETPEPDLYVFCDCPAPIAHRRIQARERSDIKMHSLEHLSQLEERYDKFIASKQAEGCLIFRLDSNNSDLRDVDTLAMSVETAIEYWKRSRKIPSQLAFQTLEESPVASSLSTVLSNPLSYPVAYIAAPFTGMTISAPEPEEGQLALFSTASPHGRIGKGRYRDTLIGISRTIESLGMRTILPHRDVNRWGDVTVLPSNVMSQCTAHVLACDLFVGILGNSSGSHYEFGIAIGAGIPSIVISCAEIQDSYLAQGVSALNGRSIALTCNSMREIPALFTRSDVRDFIVREVGMSLPPLADTNGGEKNER